MDDQLFDVTIEALVASPIHSFEGRPSDGPRESRGDSRQSIEVRAGLGVVGDRYFGRPAHARASVTVMDATSLDHVAEVVGLQAPLDPTRARRNIVLRSVGTGVDLALDGWRGRRFSIDSGDGPVEFEAHRPANPCAWMDVVYATGAFRALRGRGGMRCAPLTGGVLTLGPATLRLHPESSERPGELTRPSPA